MESEAPYPPPAAFLRQLASHNLHVLLGAALCAISAVAVWVALYYFAWFFTLGGITAVRGEDAAVPEWFDKAYAAAAAGLMLLGAAHRWFTRHQHLRDREILGWHAALEVLLIPASLTLSIWDNLTAFRHTSRKDARRAWALLVEIHRRKQIAAHELAQLDSNPRRVDRLVLTLQLCGFLDLYRRGETWCYRVTGNRAEWVARLAG